MIPGNTTGDNISWRLDEWWFSAGRVADPNCELQWTPFCLLRVSFLRDARLHTCVPLLSFSNAHGGTRAPYSCHALLFVPGFRVCGFHRVRPYARPRSRHVASILRNFLRAWRVEAAGVAPLALLRFPCGTPAHGVVGRPCDGSSSCGRCRVLPLDGSAFTSLFRVRVCRSVGRVVRNCLRCRPTARARQAATTGRWTLVCNHLAVRRLGLTSLFYLNPYLAGNSGWAFAVAHSILQERTVGRLGKKFTRYGRVHPTTPAVAG